MSTPSRFPLLSPAALAFFLSVVVLSTFFAGCRKSSVRSLPESAVRVMRTEIPTYDSGKDLERFDGMKLAGDREILAFQGGLDAAYHNRFHHDPRLDVVADIYARTFLAKESVPNAGLVEWAMRRLGIAGRIVDMSLWWTGQRHPLRHLDDILRNAAVDLPKELDAPPSAGNYTFGISRFKGDTWRHFQAHVLVENAAELDTLPKKFPLGQEISLGGRITIPNKNTTFTMTLNDAESLHIPVKTAKDGRFEIRIPAIHEPGRYFVEMRTITEPLASVSVLKLPLYVGIDESAEPDEMITNPPDNPFDTGTWPTRFADALNKKRAEIGLAPLIMEPKACAVARESAAEDAEHWYLPVVPAQEALEGAGIRVSRSDEFWSSFESLDEMIWSRLESPWFRHAVLDDRYTHLAVGFAKASGTSYDKHIGIMYLYNDVERRDRERAEALALFRDECEFYGRREPSSVDHDAYAERLEKAIDEATDVPIAYDPSLDRLARAYSVYGDLDIDGALGQWLLWKMGETGSLFRVTRRLVRGDEVSPFYVAEMKAALEKDDERIASHFAFGVSRVPKGGGVVLETAVIVSREVELDRFPKHYEAGEKLVVSGVFAAVPKFAHFMMNHPEGLTTSATIEMNSGGAFGYSIVAPSAPGRYMIEISVPEIVVDDQTVYFSRHAAVLVPIWVDAEEPVAPEDALLHPEKNPADRATWADAVLSVYNAERTAHGLSPLRRNRVADAVLAEQMLLQRSTIKTPTFVDMQDVISANGAGDTLSSFGSFDAAGDDLLAKARRMLEIPAWREEILSPRTTMFGFAVSKEGYQTLQMFLSDESDEAERRPDDVSRPAAGLSAHRELPPIVSELKGDALSKVAEANIKQIGSCFNEIARYEEEFGGRIEFDIAVGSLGNAVAVTLASSNIEADRIEACAAEAIRGWKFPLSVGRGVGFGRLGFELAGKGKKRTIKIY